ncbi:MAG: hypothetical protein J6M48_06330 [Ruminococcus sp.]|nr:hypothetical protein [Ruminococcus sp.]
MRRRIRSRRKTFPSSETWYDLEYDKDLIAQSIAKQYGILPSDQEELHYSDWLLLVGALMEDTPLGQTVLIRKENDRERLKRFSPYENRIRNEWRKFRAKQSTQREGGAPEQQALSFEKLFAKMFG